MKHQAASRQLSFPKSSLYRMPVDPTDEIVSTLPQWGHDLGSVASAVSLAISFYVAYRVYEISQHYQALALTPQLLKQIKGHNKNLDNSYVSKDWPGFQKEAARVRPTTRDLLKFVDRPLKKTIKSAIAKCDLITKSRSLNFNEPNARELMLLVVEIEADLKNHIENKKWQAKK